MLEFNASFLSGGIAYGRLVRPSDPDNCRKANNLLQSYVFSDFIILKRRVTKYLHRLMLLPPVCANEDALDMISFELQMLEDNDLYELVQLEVEKNGKTLGEAIKSTEAAFHDMAISSVILTRRYDVVREVFQLLMNGCPADRTGENTSSVILVSEELSPVMILATLPDLKGCVVQNASRASHGVILCQTMGIPVAVGVHLSSYCEGQFCLLNSEEQRIVIDPDSNLIDRNRKNAEKNNPIVLGEHAAALSKKIKMKFYSCINENEENAAVYDICYSGIGLVRTEFFYMRQHTEEEEICFYRTLSSINCAKPVFVRLADFSDEKVCCESEICIKYVQRGLRGAQFLIDNEKFLHHQIKMIAAANQNRNISIMIPYAVSADEIAYIAETIRSINSSIQNNEQFFCINSIGAMIETPSASAQIDQICDLVDYISIGSNDLTETVYGVNRDSPEFDMLFYQDESALLRIIELVSETAKKKRKKVYICGHLAEKRQLYPFFSRAGIDGLTLTPYQLKELLKTFEHR